MADWSRNHRACATTWTTLLILHQNRKTFDKSGDVKMAELTFWNQTASAPMRTLQAKTLAAQIDNMFRLTRGAQYEAGVTRTKATTDISDTLVDSDKTIADLAEVNDANYRFWGEEDDL
jgi:hypothetical protein